MSSISVEYLQNLLSDSNLLREVVSEDQWVYRIKDQDTLTSEYQAISYNSKEVDKDTIFFCKGETFKKAYLDEAIDQGVNLYISEELYDTDRATALIVSDIREAMAIIAREFYGRPDEEIKMIGITGTKGKTSTTYFTKYILNEYIPEKTAVISTIDVSLDGVHSKSSQLTTPEALDLFKMIREAVDNGMQALVMEVSSQAFKTKRVFGLKYDIGVFLNISKDHIGPNEHPNMEDYFFCKRQLVSQAKHVVLNDSITHFELVYDQAKTTADYVYIYGTDQEKTDYYVDNTANDNPYSFEVKGEGSLPIKGEYEINLLGDFNKENALSAMIVTSIIEADQESIREGLKRTTVPGRMEEFKLSNGGVVYVDFAHNYISLNSLLEFVSKEYPDRKLVTVIGAPGDKGVSRRKDFGEVLSKFDGNVILTGDDPMGKDVTEISSEIAEYIADEIQVEMINDRVQAIEHALSKISDNHVLILAGKGTDNYQLMANGHKEPYPGDNVLVERYIENNKV